MGDERQGDHFGGLQLAAHDDLELGSRPQESAGGTKPMAIGALSEGPNPPLVTRPITAPASSAISAPSRAGAPSSTLKPTRTRLSSPSRSRRIRSAPGKSRAFSRRLETAKSRRGLDRRNALVRVMAI